MTVQHQGCFLRLSPAFEEVSSSPLIRHTELSYSCSFGKKISTDTGEGVGGETVENPGGQTLATEAEISKQRQTSIFHAAI